MIKKESALDKDLVKNMNSYFDLEKQDFIQSRDEVIFIASRLKSMGSEDISILINMFGDTLAKHYLEKQRLLGNKFTYEEIEPFVHYIDSYLIEHSGGNKKELNRLAKYLVGKDYDYPTQRLMRVSILDEYFSPYFAE